MLRRIYTAARGNLCLWAFHLEIWGRGDLPILHAFIDEGFLFELPLVRLPEPLGLDFGVCLCQACIAQF